MIFENPVYCSRFALQLSSYAILMQLPRQLSYYRVNKKRLQIYEKFEDSSQIFSSFSASFLFGKS